MKIQVHNEKSYHKIWYPRHNIRQWQGLHRNNMKKDPAGFKGPQKIGMCLPPIKPRRGGMSKWDSESQDCQELC